MYSGPILIKSIKETIYSFDLISQVVSFAHEVNREKGLFYRTASMSGEQIKKVVANGDTFVAIIEDAVVGTASVALHKGIHWYDRGRLVAHYCFDAVLPEWQGNGIMKLLDERRDQFTLESGAEIIRSGTAEGNIIQRKRFIKQGFLPIDYKFIKGNNFFSVIYVKWLNTSKTIPKWKCFLAFLFRKLKTRLFSIK